LLRVETHALLAAAFEHREPRSGAPDLHTQVAVANQVRARVNNGDASPS
jgi:hypothetical protein